MKRLLFLLSILLPVSLFAAESAESMLNRAADKIRTSKSISASFSVSSTDGNASGTITLAGDKFVMKSPQMSVWYNGRTQWTYVKQAGEVNITEPTPSELQQINPFAIINGFRQNYKAKVTSRSTAQTVLTLTANAPKAEIRKVVLTLSNSTLFPSKIVMSMAGGKSVTISVSNVKTGGTLSQSVFTFNPKSLPGVEVVDLR